MDDSSVKLTKKKKRKINSSEEKLNPGKRRHIDSSSEREPIEVEEPELNTSGERPWKNLQLILTLQNKQIDLQKKVELAFSFVDSKVKEGTNDVDEDHETVNLSRLVVFLNDWVQSLLVSPEKKVKVDGNFEACLDFRCWRVFEFCLNESLKLHISLSFSRNLLRAIGYIAKHVLSLFSDTSLSPNESFFVGERFELYDVVLACVSLLFSLQSGLSNENLELWVSNIDVVLQLVLKIYDKNLDVTNIGAFALQLFCLVFESFAKFLRIHPTRKNGFRDFVDKLLEPLLLLLDVLHGRVNENGSCWTNNSLVLVKEVLSNGLFHQIHIDGFLGLHGVEKYAGSIDGKSKDSKVVVKSYHRHLFDKLESIIEKDNDFIGIGQLFHLFVDRVKKQKGVSGADATGKITRTRNFEDDTAGHLSMDPSRSSSSFPDNNYSHNNFTAEARKSLFDFFVQLLEPFLLKMDCYNLSKCNLAEKPTMLDVHCTLKSINSLLASVSHEKVYVRTEDVSEGACLNFLKKVYDTVVSVAAKIIVLSQSGTDMKTRREMFPFLAKELFFSVGYFLDIEYDVIGDGLISLWLMMLSYLNVGLSFLDSPDQSILISPILDIGCQLINLYGAFRQVNNSIFTLCKAVRLLISHHHEGEMEFARFFPNTSLFNNAISVSVETVFCSQKFKLAVCRAIKSIPEGQASELIQQLTVEISESLEWMKISCSSRDELDVIDRVMPSFQVQAELLGRVLSEIYMVLLDSLAVTAGNCSLLGPSLKELVSTIYACSSTLPAPHCDGVNKFLSSLMCRVSGHIMDENDQGMSAKWIFVFFFRLYMSCRSLYRQIISLTPPIASRKMSSAMGDKFTAYTGRDWMEIPDWTDEGYFPWIINPSPSLVDLIHHISKFYLKDNIDDCCPLIYVLHIMAIQRLTDLNRQRSSLEYLLQQNERRMQVKNFDDNALSLCRRNDKRLKTHILALEQEAVELTKFMLGYLSLVADNHSSIFFSDDISCEKMAPIEVQESDKWDFGICSVNKKSLPIAIWWIICQNIDTWSIHAADKKLKKKCKMFLALLIQTSLPSLSNNFLEAQKTIIGKESQPNTITLYQISQGLLKDSALYECKFVRRYLASSFGHALKNVVPLLFSDSSLSNRNFKSFPGRPEVLSALNDTVAVVSGRRYVKHTKSFLNSSDSSKFSRKEKTFPLKFVKFEDCKSLLNLLCWMPKGYLSLKALSKLANCVINLEQIIVAKLLDCPGALSSCDIHELLQLFVMCRRTLKNIIMTSCEENIGAISSFISVANFSSLVTWLFESVSAVIRLLESVSEDCIPESNLKIFSLMDHSSYVFFIITKSQLGHAVRITGNSKQSYIKQHYSGVGSDQSILNEPGEGMRFLCIIAESLKEQAEGLLIPLKGTIGNAKVGIEKKALDVSKMSFVVSCFNGFLWGLASAWNQASGKGGELKAKFLQWKCEPLSKLNLCIHVLVDFTSDLLCIFLENNQQYVAPGFQKLNFSWDSMVDLVELHCLDMHLLQRLVKGDYPNRAVLLRQLLITYSAIPRLNLQIDGACLQSNKAPLLVGISQFLLLEWVNSGEISSSFPFVWLDGAVKYLEELGSCFSLTDYKLNENAYDKLVELLLRAIGKCISLQGKRATLESHERESSTKIVHGDTGLSKSFLSHGSYCLDELKTRLRKSFKVLIEKPSELQLFSAIQAIERALVGALGGNAMIYEINIVNANGGMVSSTVAAGIDCMDLVLEYCSGRKCLSVVKRHIHSLVAALFNIILHLQSPLIFYGKCVSDEGVKNPDAGSVVLMCVEVLTRISGKPALFQLNPWHIGHLLRIPGALFQDFFQLRLSEAPISCNSFLDEQNHDSIASMKSCGVDREYSVNLFAACCRLLYTILKHRKSESERCIAVLEESMCHLLHCLETVDADLVGRKGSFSWELQEGIKCASFLRRIYEELRQQKDVFAGHCYKFLSTYIWVYSGFGPLKTGIRREIDEALKPGVYALIDACSANDLQHLHTVFGEGPCRNTLASLRHEYKLNFQYEGKV